MAMLLVVRPRLGLTPMTTGLVPGFRFVGSVAAATSSTDRARVT
jgi:hypothetical protein